ncbi:exodeoxyribonuclease V subunit gamma, partial [bacterium]|nr:exodeoxyribonuclease V subunit gamma [bacterium]
FAPSVEKEHLLIALSRETKRFRDFSSEATVSFDTVRYIITQLLESRSSFRGFISGGVTFCEMKPMRAIPFKMIALIGMNENSFPRSDHRLSYDLIGQIPRAGDRSIRENDRHLFLELLLSTRERLHISYTGINHRSGDELFPTVLVNRLQSLISSLYKADISFEKHPIHSFSSRYFTSGSGLSSYSSVDEQCARQFSSRSDEKSSDNRLTVHDVPAPDNRMTLNLFQLANFFSNPAYYFAKQVLKLRLPDTPDEDETTATKFSLSALERWTIIDELLKRYEKAESAAQVDTIVYIELAGSGKLPWGKVGKQLFYKLTKIAWNLFVRSEQIRQGEKPDELFVDYHFKDKEKQLTLISQFSGIYPSVRVLHNPSKELKANKKIGYLLQHLMMQTATENDLHIFFGTGRKSLAFHHLGIEQPQRILDEIIHYFFEGLTRPLPFLPDFSAHLYSIIKKGDRDPQTAIQMSLKHHYDNPPRFPKPFENEALTMSGLEDASLETATKACDMATLIFGTLHETTGGRK